MSHDETNMVIETPSCRMTIELTCDPSLIRD
ncbi:hypothetical protein T230_11060 [Tannerella sp. oral taxon BU063 isolate Cell 1/3]|uniref:Uncharacterized protein n=1 Tax=Tannerella sp. oral taxon BU063 isolate Cell 1/3 TaxID=1411022 RepID=W2CJT1_9BACT|nr:hypothetical protein T230_11060 [Tannerella sp. oral taxon BU063 isolate Cell 1/3]